MFLSNLIFYIGIIILHLIAFLFDVVLLPFYFIVQQPWRILKWSRRERAVKIQIGEDSITWRSLEQAKALHSEMSREHLATMADVMEYFCRKYKDKKFLGTRETLNEEHELSEGKTLLKLTLGKYRWKTFKESNHLSENFGKGIRGLDSTGKRRVAIFAETRAEWMLAIQGLFKQNIPVVTVYANLGDDGIIHALKETETEILITSHELIPKVMSISHKLNSLKKIVYMEDPIKTISDYKFRSIDVCSFTSVILNGKRADKIDNRFPKGSDLAIIMYTSGSTGVPKGVQILHSNLVSTLKAFVDVTENLNLKEGERLIGFLPLAHVFELLVECVCLCRGITIGYSSSLTLLDKSSKIKRNMNGDATVLKPHYMTSVPLIMDRIVKDIEETVNNGNVLKKSLFYFALKYKLFWYRLGFSTHIINRLVFHKVASILGGELRLIFSGGAPLTPETHSFVEAVLNVKILQGYGLTETTACATVMDGYERNYGRVGPPTTVCDIMLMNWVEGGYNIQDKPNPRGEIIVGGNNVTAGYYKHQDKTKQDYFEANGEKWFKTGDIGEVLEDGSIKIIDRMTDMIKLQNGLFISLGKVEAVLKKCIYVDNIFVHADSNRNHCVALITPNESKLISLANSLKVHSDSFRELCRSNLMNDQVLAEIVRTGKNCNLEKFEIPKVITLISDSWTPESGLVTAAMKLKRKDILERYPHEIKVMYEERFF